LEESFETEVPSLLWVLQVLAALLYGVSGVLKVFMAASANSVIISGQSSETLEASIIGTSRFRPETYPL